MGMKKWINILTYGIGIGVLATLIGLSIAVSVKTGKIRRLKNDIRQKELVIDSLEKRCEALGNMDAIRVTTTFQVKNINTLGIQHTGNIQQLSESYAAYTRQYLLDSVINKN